MASSTLLLLIVATQSSRASEGPWSRRSLRDYVKLRAGGSSGERIWRSRGVLSNTMTGARISSVESLERCRNVGDDEELGYCSERVLVYRDGNGTRLAKPLRYSHKVSMELRDGNLLLRAQPGDSSSSSSGADSSSSSSSGSAAPVVASGWGVGRGPTRAGPLCRAFELSIRPKKADAAGDEEPPTSDMPAGWPRAANRGSVGTTREEYRLVEPARPGGSCSLTYKRTGKCPHWYGGGVCTLELEATCEPAARRWWQWRPRRTSSEQVDEATRWDQQVKALVGE